MKFKKGSWKGLIGSRSGAVVGPWRLQSLNQKYQAPMTKETTIYWPLLFRSKLDEMKFNYFQSSISTRCSQSFSSLLPYLSFVRRHIIMMEYGKCFCCGVISHFVHLVARRESRSIFNPKDSPNSWAFFSTFPPKPLFKFLPHS